MYAVIIHIRNLKTGKMICQHIKSGSHCKVCEVAPIKKKRARLRAVSEKHKLELKVYSADRKMFLYAHPECAVCGGVATQVHHSAGRLANLNNIDTWVAVCMECHARIENEPTWAKEQGYSHSRLI